MNKTATADESLIPPGISVTHFEALQKRGLTPNTIIAAKLKSVSAEDIRDILGFNPPPGPEARRLGLSGSPGIGIPNFDPMNPERIRQSRFRLDYPAEISGKPAKYVGPKKAGNIIYFPPGIGDKLPDVSMPMFITEGPFQTIMGHQNGLCTIGLAGVWGWKCRGLNGESQPIADLDLIAWKDRFVIIVFDSDVMTNQLVQKARHELGKELSGRGANVYAITLPPATDGSKQGLDDYLKENGLIAFQQIDVVELPRTDIPPFTSPLSELLEGPEELIAWGIEGIQPVGASGFHVASPKTAKSWEMAEEAYCHATGQPLFGHFKVPVRRRVLIIEEEDNLRRVQRRLKRIIHAHGGIKPADEYFRISVKKGVRLDDLQWREVLEWEINNFRPEFVYLDVWNRLHTKNINDAQEMSELVLFLDYLTRTYGSAFIILHHDRKMNGVGDAHNEIMGSRVLGGFTEATMFLSHTKEKGVLKVKVVLKDEPEDGSFIPEFQVRLTDTPDGRGTYFEYLGVPPERQASIELREKIKTFVLGQDESVTTKQVSEGVGCSKPTARENLSALVDIKIIGRISQGNTHLFCSPEKVENFQ